MKRTTAAFAASFYFFTSIAAADTRPLEARSPEAGSLEEVVVTAQLRERELRELPASATVLDARTLESAGVHHFQDVLALVPNLNWSAGTSRPRFFQLRGIGELEQWQGAPNPSVGFLIDGIDFSGIGMAATLGDVERIEVLRGPQGTVYGANALAGLISVTTRAPQRDPSIDTRITLGERGTRGVSGAIGGPLGDGETAWRLSASKYESDGFRRNSFLRRDDTNGYDENSARLRVSARPFDNLRADITAMWVDLDNGYDAFSIDNSRTTLSDKPGEDTQLTRAIAAKLVYDGNASFDVVSLTSFGDTRGVYSFDGDWGNDESWGVSGPYDYFQRFDRARRTLSQDLRIVSRESLAQGADFAWLAGAYAMRVDEDVQQHDFYNGDTVVDLASDYRATNLAVYGEVEWRLAAQTVLAVGARAEHRDADYADTNAATFSPGETMSGGSVSLRHAVSDTRRVYATLARGYKAGGFNIGSAVPPAQRTFDSEVLHSLELGFKAANDTGSLDGDVAVFYMKRESQQVPTGEQIEPGNPLSFVLYTDNAARGENYGVEGTLRWRPTTSLLLDLRAAMLETRYLGYQFGERNLDGREQAHAPEYQYDVGVEYSHAQGWFTRVDLAGLDDFYFDASHDERAPSRVLAHLKTGYSGKHWRAEVWVRNVFDRYYAQRGFRFGNEPPDFAPTRYVQAGDPRHVGVTVAYTFR
jgi:outer membrane receptor protein involved in Fe transport